MKKKEVLRLFNFSDANLITIGNQKIAFMKRDASSFTAFGILPAMVTALQNEINAFSDQTTDQEALSDQAGVTVQKDAKADALREAIRAVMSRAERKFGQGTAKYNKFGTGNLSKQTDAELLVTAKRVVRVGTEYLTLLADTGLTAAMLTTITTLRSEFSNLIVDLGLAIGNRDVVQEDRVEQANAIYKKLISYTNTGQDIWATTDVAKYNDYVVYNTVTGAAEEDTPPAL